MRISLTHTALLHLAAANGAKGKIQQAASRASHINRTDERLWSAPVAIYLICTTPRSGSWMLSQGLAGTRVAGNPREWLNPWQEQDSRAEWRASHSTDLTFKAYLRLARNASTTKNGISGIKLHYHHLAEACEKVSHLQGWNGLDEKQFLRNMFPGARYIWLTRRDKARQAISFSLALNTGEWYSVPGSPRDSLEHGTNEPEFDPNTIFKLEHFLTSNDTAWRSFFDTQHIAPLVIEYETLASDYEGTIRAVLKWLGAWQAQANAIAPPRLKRQWNARSDDWLARYDAWKNSGGVQTELPIQNDSDQFVLQTLRQRRARVTDSWKRWVGYSQLLKAKNEPIVEVLTKNGYSRETAMAEVRTATSDQYLMGAVQAHQQSRKAVWLLNALGYLARYDSKVAEIDHRTKISVDEFRDKYYAANRPVVFDGLINEWPSLTRWTPEYLKSMAGDSMVEVMTNRESDPEFELNASRHRTTVCFADYVNMVFSGRVTNDYYLVANNGFLRQAETQALLQDCVPLPEYLKPTAELGQCFFWFGPAGTVTPLHYDKINILVAQVSGRKRFTLIPASQWAYVYNKRGVFSDVDAENPDLARFPRFSLANRIEVILEPGQTLFLPVGWWHQVRALDTSITISFTSFIYPNSFNWE